MKYTKEIFYESYEFKGMKLLIFLSILVFFEKIKVQLKL